MAIFCFLVWVYPVGLYRNMQQTDYVDSRSFHTVLITLATFLFTSSPAHMLIAGCPDEEVAGAFATLLSITLYAFCDILAGPDALSGSWIFMYSGSPFTYLLSSFMSTTLGKAIAYCADIELQHFAPANGTCDEYMQEHMSMAGGRLRDN